MRPVRKPAPQRAGGHAASLRERREKAAAGGRREQLEIEQSQEIDGAEFAIPGRLRGDPRANGQIGLEQLGDFDLDGPCGFRPQSVSSGGIRFLEAG